MHHLPPAAARATLRAWLPPERPGPLVGEHYCRTGVGACYVDRLPVPRVVLVHTADNVRLLGAAAAVPPATLAPLVRGYVEAAPAWKPVLRAAMLPVTVWQRIIAVQAAPPPDVPPPPGATVRRLTVADSHHLHALSPDLHWISKTWGGAHGLARNAGAWGVWHTGRLVAVACPFYLGQHYADIGVVTEAAVRGRGYSPACAAALCRALWAQGRQPTWTTAPDNTASQRVAAKLGFVAHRTDVLYVTGIAPPT